MEYNRWDKKKAVDSGGRARRELPRYPRHVDRLGRQEGTEKIALLLVVDKDHPLKPNNILIWVNDPLLMN